MLSSKAKFIPTSGSYPAGYSVGSTACGIKKSGLDLMVLKSTLPANAAGMFTMNKFKAAPVVVCKEILESTKGKGIQGIVVNSGCANAVTGKDGLRDANKMIDLVGRPSLVMSTGVIGQLLPMNKIEKGIETIQLGQNHDDWLNAAKAICTTDTFPKLVSKSFKVGSTVYNVAGMAKGAGMIHPNMATMLSFFVTDAPVHPTALKSILKYAVDRSFNAISVDGDMSTNDTILALANGAAGGDLITEDSEAFHTLKLIIADFAKQLAQLVVRDGEGATKFVTISVTDAKSFEDAKQVASTVARSPLVKTALNGEDANWGRILCAVGYSEVDSVIPEKTSVSFVPADGSPELKLLVNGEPQTIDEEEASRILSFEDLNIRISLGIPGGATAEYYTCDFSHDYIAINADYRS
ncbi:hypothetical protein CANCADRAFT_23508 [Tortispora caseinolytica NRRL Y-17796]|uniref:Arginine biosynthesis bifunctional protein ArgJ, mitochondrial n=1 Tax=Tortispora caseinolytica NRRL Y-17796 TaxID=767744 RepID=A0A1E4TKL9_9ASCO|nr:hypothetical protein CANCADRAFT_23508 [Tortispora caseinolytica NRRL Y-17796]